MKPAILICISLILSTVLFSQTNKELAYEKANIAISLMDNGQVTESIKLLEECKKLDPENVLYSYEIGFAYYTLKDYKKAIKILEPFLQHPNTNDQFFQLVGNSYDIIGKQNKALLVYNAGLQKFPNSGKLYLEKGNVYWGLQQYNNALNLYEKGIEVNPLFPSNYYRAALLYCNSQNEVWGIMYGEIFMNLETKSKRTIEISKHLLKTYTSEIKNNGDTAYSVSFCKNASISFDQLLDTTRKFTLPFGMVYEMVLLMSIPSSQAIDIASLHIVRQNFIKNYYNSEYHLQYPNVLFDYQKMIYEAGHFEAYNYWVLSIGNKEVLAEWITQNQQKWNDFETWFNQNKFPLNSENAFYSKKYE